MPAEAASGRPLRVWVTRARPQADATAERLREMGFEPVLAPVLDIRPIDGVRLDLAGVDALAFTSAAGVSAFAGLSPARAFSVFAVGDATAEAARAAGFSNVRSAQGDAEALAGLIAAAAPRPTLVLNPTAADPAADLAGLLAALGVAARSTAVYEARERALGASPADLDCVLIHSLKAGRVAAALLAGRDVSALAVMAISAAAAAPFAGLRLRGLAIAPFPNEAALLSLLQG
jgi:uroporphyrinogen-III synthase